MRRSPPRRWLAGSLIGLGAWLIAWGFWWEPGHLVVREVELRVDGWNDAHAGLRVALLADLHVGSPRNGIENLRRVIRKTNETDPDIVLLLGDLVISGVPGGRFVSPERIAAELAALQPGVGSFAVIGNHDAWLDADRVTEALHGVGIQVLRNTATRVDWHGAGLWLGGVNDFWTGEPDLQATSADVTDGEPLVLFTHNPDIFPFVPSRATLTIAGHTHGGQVNIPLLGRPLVPSLYGERYAAGHVVEDGRDLFVSTGVGTSRLGVRFRVPPEVTILELHPASSARR